MDIPINVNNFLFYHRLQNDFINIDTNKIPDLLIDSVILIPNKRNIEVLQKNYKIWYQSLKRKKYFMYIPKLDDFASSTKKTIKIEYTKDNLVKWFKKYTIWKKQNLNKIINFISSITNKIPLYQELYKTVVVFNSYEILDKLRNDYFRLPDQEIYDKIKGLINNNKINKVQTTQLKKDLNFLDCYNFDILFKTYEQIIYKYTTQSITNCRKPGFLYVQYKKSPFFSGKELIKMALLLGILPDDKSYDDLFLDTKKKDWLCNKIKAFDIDKRELIAHQKYINKNKGIDLLNYYSFLGDTIVNNYLRDLYKNNYKNIYLEKNITNIWKLIKNAPPLSKSYIVYRFVDNDSFLSHLKIGDIFYDKGIMSTTRDPYYVAKDYVFGNYAIKIHLPANTKGTVLLMESYSLFPQELECLLAPRTKLKLINKGWKYYHTNKEIEDSIVQTYEFELVEIQKEIKFDKYRKLTKQVPILTFNKQLIPGKTIYDKRNNFIKKYFTDINQFKLKVNDKTYVFTIDNYDSIGIYEKAFYYKTKEGIVLSYQNPKTSKICLVIELGKELHVNRYLNFFNQKDCEELFDDTLLCYMLSNLARTLGIEKVCIHPFNSFCNTFSEFNKYNNYGYNISLYKKDIYEYLANKKIRFKNIIGIENNIKENLDKLELIEIPMIIKKKTVYKSFKQMDYQNNLKDFYIFVTKYLCHQLEYYNNLLVDVLKKNNINKDLEYYYTLNPEIYLKNNK
jgi:hypothetical protein